MTENCVVFCDFDGTITQVDIGLDIMEHFAPPEWIESERRWRRGEISTRENMETQFNMIPTPPDEIRTWLRSRPLRAGAKGFIQLCRRRGVPFHLLSDGLDFYIDPILEAHGLDDVAYYANCAHVNKNGRWRIEAVHGNEMCGQHGCCKCQLIERLDPGHAARRIYIGDAYSDLCPSRHADVLFARDVLAEHCRETGREFTPFEDFAEIAEKLWQEGLCPQG